VSPAWSSFVQNFRLDLLSAVVLSILLGGAIGLERELKGKAAGLRTNILICMGAALFTRVGIDLSGSTPDTSRVAAQVVTGVGFLGAGTILHGKGSITGLTSAATIWLVAAIGTSVGAGDYYLASGTTLIALAVLRILGWSEDYLRRRAGVSKVRIELENDPRRVEDVETLARQAGVQVDEITHEVVDGKLIVGVTLRGPKRNQDQAKLALLRATGTYTVSLEEE
jgi:putative Mg2+ transporter-C (MgtC) family protein